MNQETEPEVVTRKRGHMRGQSVAGPKPRQNLDRQIRSHGVVSDERDPTFAGHPSGARLGQIMEQRSEPHSLASGELIGQRLSEDRADLGRQFREQRVRIRGQGDRALQHVKRVIVDIEMVVVALLYSAQRQQLGQDDPPWRPWPRAASGRPGPPAGTIWRSSANVRSPGHVGQAGRGRSRRVPGGRVDREVQLDGQTV